MVMEGAAKTTAMAIGSNSQDEFTHFHMKNHIYARIRLHMHAHIHVHTKPINLQRFELMIIIAEGEAEIDTTLTTKRLSGGHLLVAKRVGVVPVEGEESRVCEGGGDGNNE
jgi:hypothetical protein